MEEKVVSNESLDKRLRTLEAIHLWGGLLILVLGVGLYVKYCKHK